jgi:hypothetical protein
LAKRNKYYLKKKKTTKIVIIIKRNMSFFSRFWFWFCTFSSSVCYLLSLFSSYPMNQRWMFRWTDINEVLFDCEIISNRWHLWIDFNLGSVSHWADVLRSGTAGLYIFDYILSLKTLKILHWQNYITYTRSYTNDLHYHRKKPTLQHNITNNNTLRVQW